MKDSVSYKVSSPFTRLYYIMEGTAQIIFPDGCLTKEDGKGKWWEGYDPQKLYAQGKNREEAIAKLRSAIAELVVEGIDTNTDFILKILENENFKTNQYDTSFVEKEMLTL